MKWTRLLPLGTALMICGCEKLPELPVSGETKEKQAEAITNSVGDSQPPAVKPTPVQIISAFKAKPSTQLAEEDILELAALESGLELIKELDLKGSRLSPAALNALANFTSLEQLNLEAASFGGGNLSGISKLTSLKTLDLSRTAANNAALETLSGLTSLRVLKLSETVINDDGLNHLSELSLLEELDISGTETVGVGLAAFGNDGAKAPLRILRAAHTNLGAQGFRFVNQFPLEELFVSKSMVTDLSLAGLRGCDQLKVLDLSFNQITDDGAKWLVSSQVLENIDLSRNLGTGDGTLRRLQTISTLKQINLTKTACSAKAIQGLKKRLPECEVLVEGQTL